MHEKNLGKGAALRTLFKKARQFSPHVVVTLDADGQHNPNEIPSVVKPILDQGYDVVVGSRLKSKSVRNLIPWHRRVGNIALTRMTEAGQPNAILDTQSGFRAYGKEALLILTPTEQGMGVDSELIMMARQENLRLVELPATVRYDVPKPSKRNSIRHALDSVASILKFISRRHPMIFYGGPGLSSMAVGLASGIYAVHFYQTEGFVPLGPTLLAVGATVTGLLFLFTGIILFTLINVLRESG